MVTHGIDTFGYALERIECVYGSRAILCSESNKRAHIYNTIWTVIKLSTKTGWKNSEHEPIFKRKLKRIMHKIFELLLNTEYSHLNVQSVQRTKITAKLPTPREWAPKRMPTYIEASVYLLHCQIHHNNTVKNGHAPQWHIDTLTHTYTGSVSMTKYCCWLVNILQWISCVFLCQPQPRPPDSNIISMPRFFIIQMMNGNDIR